MKARGCLPVCSGCKAEAAGSQECCGASNHDLQGPGFQHLVSDPLHQRPNRFLRESQPSYQVSR